MDINLLMKKIEQAYGILGWQAGGTIVLSYNDIEVGDLWIHLPLHTSVVSGDLLGIFKEKKEHLEKIFEDGVKHIQFIEDDNADSGYSVAIELDPDFRLWEASAE